MLAELSTEQITLLEKKKKKHNRKKKPKNPKKHTKQQEQQNPQTYSFTFSYNSTGSASADQKTWK